MSRTKRLFFWIKDRRFALISKRVSVDAPDNNGQMRVWWKWYLFDLIRIALIQDPVCYTVNPKPQGVGGKEIYTSGGPWGET